MRNIARSRNLLEQALPKPALRPSIVAIVDRGRWAVFKRHVAPAASRLENVQDATDDATIIDVALGAGQAEASELTVGAGLSKDESHGDNVTASR